MAKRQQRDAPAAADFNVSERDLSFPRADKGRPDLARFLSHLHTTTRFTIATSASLGPSISLFFTILSPLSSRAVTAIMNLDSVLDWPDEKWESVLRQAPGPEPYQDSVIPSDPVPSYFDNKPSTSARELGAITSEPSAQTLLGSPSSLDETSPVSVWEHLAMDIAHGRENFDDSAVFNPLITDDSPIGHLSSPDFTKTRIAVHRHILHKAPLPMMARNLSDQESLAQLQEALYEMPPNTGIYGLTPNYEDTLLHMAVREAKPECIAYMMAIDPSIRYVKNPLGDTALSAAKRELYMARLDVLRQFELDFSPVSPQLKELELRAIC